jgi:hypothetical protein
MVLKPGVRGWKMCDYRPLFGAIFAEQIKGYRNWAWTDTDAFVGNIAKYISLEDLNTFDMVTALKMQTHQLYTR